MRAGIQSLLAAAVIAAGTARPPLTAQAPAAEQQPQWTSIGPDGGILAALARAPNQPRTLYTATLQGSIWKSLNGGQDWASAGIIPGGQLTALAVDAANSEVVYAAAGGEVWKSADAGRTWLKSSAVLPG